MCVTHLYSEFNASGDYFADRFTPLRQVFLVNLRGAGQSPSADVPSDLGMSAAVKDLEAVRASLGFSSWDFAGHSTGGMLGLLYGILHSRSLTSLIVVGAAAAKDYSASNDCIYHPDHPQFQRMQDLIETLKSPDLSADDRGRLARARTELSLYQPDRYDDYFSGGVTKRIAANRLSYFGAHDYPEFDLKSDLSKVQVPTFVLCGRHDVQCPVRSSVEIYEGIAGARLTVFEGSNHYPFLEEADVFYAEIQLFLSDV
jgi:proline iminopeptidase